MLIGARPGRICRGRGKEGHPKAVRLGAERVECVLGQSR